ncbi:MAG: hypothetical protein AAF985_19910, partial [Bacteroidota bacterium]
MDNSNQRSILTLQSVFSDAAAYDQLRRRLMPFIHNLVKRQQFSYRVKLDSQVLFTETMTKAFLLSQSSNTYQERGKLDRWLIKIAQLLSKQYSKKVSRLGITQFPAHLGASKTIRSLDNMEEVDGLMAKIFNDTNEESRDEQTGLNHEQIHRLKLIKKRMQHLP